MHWRKITKEILILLGFILLLSDVSTAYVAHGAGMADAVPRNVLRSLGISLSTAEGEIQWNRTYGGADIDFAYAAIQTADGGFALAGRTASFGAGSEDCWLVKTDTTGNMEWQQTYGGAGPEGAGAVIQTADGGFALAGWTASFGAGGNDYYLVKTDAHGNMEWQQTYGGSEDEAAGAVIQTTDGGFALGWRTFSFGAGGRDAWLVKTDAHGNMEWQQTYGGSKDDEAKVFVETADGGFALAGKTKSYGAGDRDAWLVKTDVHGNIEWNWTYGGAGSDGAYAGIQTADGGFALVGSTNSFGAGGYDFWLVKTDARGTFQWTQTYGGSGSDWATSIIQTVDGGFALAGWTASFGAGHNDYYLVKTDAHGNMEWQQTYGDSEPDDAYSVIQTADGGFALAGRTGPYGEGETEAWLVKTIPPESTLPEFSVPTVTVASPNGGEVWQEMQTITWTAINPQADPLTYTVYYSPNGGQTWIQLAAGLTEPSYLWNTTTIENGANYLIKVVASDGTHTAVDVSNEPFEITNAVTNTAPTVLVIRPNGGERVRGIFEIQWQAIDPDGDTLTYTISYSPNNGDTWTQLASEVTGTSYKWDTSGVQVGENYLIKIEASDGNFTIEDRSDAPFTVEREVPAETHSESFFVPSFRVVEALDALLILLGLGKRQRRRKLLWEGQ